LVAWLIISNHEWKIKTFAARRREKKNKILKEEIKDERTKKRIWKTEVR
jgi:hypothetical protein